MLDVDQTFRAGATRNQYINWLNLTSDKFILQTITGARLEFEEPPNQTYSPQPLKFSDQEFNLMRLDCFMASIHLTNAYFSIPIAEEHRCFLRFVWMDELYQFTVLPNGLSSAPRIFTKVLKPVYAHLRQLGHITCGYIDDSFIMGDTYDTCLTSIRATHDLFKSI